MKRLFCLFASVILLSCSPDEISETQVQPEEKLFEAIGTWTYVDNGIQYNIDGTSTVEDFKKWLEYNSNLTNISVTSLTIRDVDNDSNTINDIRITCMLYAKANPDNDPLETPNDYKLSFNNLNGQVYFIGNIEGLKSLQLQYLNIPAWDVELHNNGEGGLAKQVIDNYPDLKYWNSSNNQWNYGNPLYDWTPYYKNQIENLCTSNGGLATF